MQKVVRDWPEIPDNRSERGKGAESSREAAEGNSGVYIEGAADGRSQTGLREASDATRAAGLGDRKGI